MGPDITTAMIPTRHDDSWSLHTGGQLGSLLSGKKLSLTSRAVLNEMTGSQCEWSCWNTVLLSLTAPNTLEAMCLSWCVFCELWLYGGRWDATSLIQSVPFILPEHCPLQMMTFSFSSHDTERTCEKIPGVSLTFFWTIECESELCLPIVRDLSSQTSPSSLGEVCALTRRWLERESFSQGWNWNPTSIRLRNPQLRMSGPLQLVRF